MIELSDLIDLQLEALFGQMLPPKIKALINRELDMGAWVDGYEEAVKQQDLDSAESTSLLEVLLREHPSSRLDTQALCENIASELPQSSLAQIQWLVAGGTNFVMTDSLRVAYFNREKVIWCTHRFALDGIKLLEIRGSILSGLAWQGSESYVPDEPFKIEIARGAFLTGGNYRW